MASDHITTTTLSDSKNYQDFGPKDKANQNEMDYIELLMDIPEFIGKDLQHYGPFKKGQIIEVSMGMQRNAEIMVDKSVARSYILDNRRMSFYRGPITNIDPEKKLDIILLYELIKSDRYKDQILSVRSSSKDDLDKKKRNLDYVTPAGVFEARNKNGLLEPSGYAPIDIDNIGACYINEIKNKLKGDKYISLLFTSPSGSGLKALIKVPQDSDYSDYVEEYYNYLSKNYGIDIKNLDKQTKDISRACFVSYDPDAFLNLESKMFEQKFKNKPIRHITGKIKTPTLSWTEDFLLEYCLKNKLPEGERHTVIEKNMAILLRSRSDKDELIARYLTVQEQPSSAFNGWLENEEYKEVNAKEIEKYIKRYDIPYKMPEIKDEEDLIQYVKDKLILKQTTEATEAIVKYFETNNKIYTTRDDISSEVWIYKDGIYIPQGKTFITEYVRKITGNAFTTYFCNQVIAKIEADTFIDQNDFFNNWNKEEIIIQNGVLNLENRTLSEYTPDKIFFNKIPVVYDPKKECPSIKKHFQAVLKYEDDVPVLFEIFGFLLWKEYFIEKAIMLSGSGRNGKGKTVELMKRFIGVENCTNIPLQQLENDRFALGELFNKMANLSPDICSTALKQTGVFKSLTGRDEQHADRKFQARVKFVNHAKMIYCANELPRTYDTTPAFWNRWILLEFPYTFLSQKEMENRGRDDSVKLADPNIIEKLTTPDELSGLLNEALDGLDRLRKQGDFSYSKNTEEVKNMWIRKSDSFASFFMDRCKKAFGSYIKKEDLSKAYLEYCAKHNLKPMGTHSIKYTLEYNGCWEDRKVEYDDTHNDRSYVRVWFGLELVEEKGQIILGECERVQDVQDIHPFQTL